MGKKTTNVEYMFTRSAPPKKVFADVGSIPVGSRPNNKDL